jgi:hypothetical protein
MIFLSYRSLRTQTTWRSTRHGRVELGQKKVFLGCCYSRIPFFLAGIAQARGEGKKNGLLHCSKNTFFSRSQKANDVDVKYGIAQ